MFLPPFRPRPWALGEVPPAPSQVGSGRSPALCVTRSSRLELSRSLIDFCSYSYLPILLANIKKETESVRF